MEKKIEFKGVGLHYRDIGAGKSIVLLHGYLETGEIWKGFSEGFLKGYRVIIPDLPGHGESGTWGKIHTMTDLAGSVKAILDKEGVRQTFLIGHSMGGYVTMAFADHYPERLTGYCLFHSTCFADSEEKKENRDREISLVLCKKKRQIINVNIPKSFASDNLQKFKREVEQTRKIALTNSDRGIIALLNGMKARRDRSDVLVNTALPLLLVGGLKDNYISREVFERLVALAPHARVLRLKESGHMGFIEEPEVSVLSIIDMMD